MPMTVDFYDVGHGNCTVITCPNGKKIMIDTGHSESRPWYPSATFRGHEIELLILTNYDEDHLSDLAGVKSACNLHWYRRNKSITAAGLIDMKRNAGELGPGVKAAIEHIREYEGVTSSGEPDLGAAVTTSYWNRYPNDFSDTNNLSFVTFLSYQGYKFVFPGDLEKAGWEKLLEREDFRSDLKDVTVFVASHHGRVSGCCSAVFEHCSPRIAVMSDRNKNFETQETTQWYGQRVQGVNWSGAQRRVFTTRQYGDIRIGVKDDGGWTIDVQKGI